MEAELQDNLCGGGRFRDLLQNGLLPVRTRNAPSGLTALSARSQSSSFAEERHTRAPLFSGPLRTVHPPQLTQTLLLTARRPPVPPSTPYLWWPFQWPRTEAPVPMSSESSLSNGAREPFPEAKPKLPRHGGGWLSGIPCPTTPAGVGAPVPRRLPRASVHPEDGSPSQCS